MSWGEDLPGSRANMMEFFVPGSPDVGDAKRAWNAIRSNLDVPSSRRRVFSLAYWQEHRPYVDEVGQPSHVTQETVLAIFESDRLYQVVTASRGGSKGSAPLVVGKLDSDAVVYFD